jgi:hypothetical protein
MGRQQKDLVVVSTSIFKQKKSYNMPSIACGNLQEERHLKEFKEQITHIFCIVSALVVLSFGVGWQEIVLACEDGSILTLDRHADDQEGLWSRGEAAQYTHEILQSVRDPCLLTPEG